MLAGAVVAAVVAVVVAVAVSSGRGTASAGTGGRLTGVRLERPVRNQGTENSRYVTSAYLRRMLQAVPGLNLEAALSASRTPAADAALAEANSSAAREGITGTPFRF
jgi:hypothetical protein